MPKENSLFKMRAGVFMLWNWCSFRGQSHGAVMAAGAEQKNLQEKYITSFLSHSSVSLWFL